MIKELKIQQSESGSWNIGFQYFSWNLDWLSVTASYETSEACMKLLNSCIKDAMLFMLDAVVSEAMLLQLTDENGLKAIERSSACQKHLCDNKETKNVIYMKEIIAKMEAYFSYLIRNGNAPLSDGLKLKVLIDYCKQDG